MKKLLLSLLLLATATAHADTPAPGIVGIKNISNQQIDSTTDSGVKGFNVHVTNPFGGPLTVNQGTSPWVVSGSVSISNFPSTFGVTQSTSPWVVSGTVNAAQSGSWTVTANAGTNLNTSALALESGGHLASIDGKIPALGQALAAGSVPVVLTASQLATLTPLSTIAVTQSTSPWVVSGAVTGSGNFTVVQPTGTNLHVVVDSAPTTIVNQGTSPWVVSGTVNAAQSGAWTVTSNQGTSPWVVSGTVSATQSGTWTVQQGGAPWSVSQSGTWNINNISGTISLPTGASTAANQTNGTQLTGLVAGSAAIGTVAPNPDSQPATATITTQDIGSITSTGANAQKFITGTPTASSTTSFVINTLDTVRIQTTGTWTGTLQTEVSLDGGTTWFTNGLKQTGAAQTASSFTGNFSGHMNVTGFNAVRVRAVAAMSGTVTVLITKSYNVNTVSIGSTVKPEDSQGNSTITSTTPVSVGSSGGGTMVLTVTGTWAGSIQLLGGALLSATTGTQLWFRQVGGDDMNSFTGNGTYCVDTAGFPAVIINPATFTSGTLTYSYDVGVGANKTCGSGAQAVSLGNNNKTAVMKTGELSTNATTSNQVILTYTVTAGKTFYLQYFKCTANTEAAAVTATAFGTCSLSINGTIVYTDWLHGDGANNYPIGEQLSEAIPVAAGQTILIETTPAAATAFFWYANFGGYER